MTHPRVVNDSIKYSCVFNNNSDRAFIFDIVVGGYRFATSMVFSSMDSRLDILSCRVSNMLMLSEITHR